MLFAQQLLNGLLDGVYYLLIALGLSLIFSLGGIVNLAHGAFFAIGAYLTLVLSPYLGFGGSLVVAPVAVALLGVVIERLLFRRFYRADPILSLLLTFGLAMVAEQALRMIFGAPPLSYSIRLRCEGRWSRDRLSTRSTARCCWASPPAVSRHCGSCCKRHRSAAWCGRGAESRHGRGIGNFAAALHVGRGGARYRTRRSRRRAAGADLFGPSGDGQRDHHAGFRRGGDRRPRIVLGRGGRGAAGRTGQGRDGRDRLFGPRPPPRSIC